MGVLIAAFAVLPGLPGEKIYSFFVGSNWREDKWSRTLRLLAFSLFGLNRLRVRRNAYRSTVAAIHLGQRIRTVESRPIRHVCSRIPRPRSRRDIFRVLGGRRHAHSRSTVGQVRVLQRMGPFIRSCVKDHWVTVGFSNGEVYAGYIETAESSVAAAERDLVLREPALYDQRLMRYRSLPYQSLFLLASTIASVAVIFDAAKDKRITRIGESPFAEGGNDGIGET